MDEFSDDKTVELIRKGCALENYCNSKEAKKAKSNCEKDKTKGGKYMCTLCGEKDKCNRGRQTD